MPGIISLLIMRIAVHIYGVKTDLAVYPIISATCVFVLHYGMAMIRYLKERLFGLSNPQGNHGEDVKELYYYLDNLPTHYYMEYLYKYPQQAFPYDELREENQKRTKEDPEYEILDTGVFDNNQYFDVLVTYAKQGAEDIFIKIDITNRYSKAAEITLLPTLWFYNRWNHGMH